MLINQQGKKVNLPKESKHKGEKAKWNMVRASLREVFSFASPKDAPKGWFSLESRARLSLN